MKTNKILGVVVILAMLLALFPVPGIEAAALNCRPQVNVTGTYTGATYIRGSVLYAFSMGLSQDGNSITGWLMIPGYPSTEHPALFTTTGSICGKALTLQIPINDGSWDSISIVTISGPVRGLIYHGNAPGVKVEAEKFD